MKSESCIMKGESFTCKKGESSWEGEWFRKGES